ncbi:MAG: asparagine synthetase B [Rhodohalobacter sp.]|uniref:asparagine synthetase B n=1 Tax=Rhodohalobacter sp. TaxID=1974210 RepID=UPI0039760970
MKYLCIPLIISMFIGLSSVESVAQNRVLIPMDGSQTNHLKAYGIIFNHLNEGETGQWLLNYRGGSFLTTESHDIVRKSRIRNVNIEIIPESQASQIIGEVENPGVNMAAINLEAAPNIAVYTPPGSLPWDDAVTLVLDYAEIPYDTVYDREVLSGELSEYDWLHLHHEDFTGQFGKFWSMYRNAPWYINQVQEKQTLAEELGYEKVSQLKLDIVHNIREFVGNGGFMFAMCSATDTFDIALAAEGLDIIPTEIDGDPTTPDVNNRLNFDQTFTFENFSAITDPNEYEHSTIDIEVDLNRISESLDYFTLFDFSAKWDPVPTMLTQNHVNSIRGFYGQATAFQRDKIKSSSVILAESPGRDQVKYVHGNYGTGTFTFYGGHDPEDYTHRVGDPPTDLNLHTNSPGYRLILNNILFPAAEKKKKQT